MSGTPGREEIKKLTPQERARLALQMLQPKEPQVRVLDEDPSPKETAPPSSADTATARPIEDEAAPPPTATADPAPSPVPDAPADDVTESSAGASRSDDGDDDGLYAEAVQDAAAAAATEGGPPESSTPPSTSATTAAPEGSNKASRLFSGFVSKVGEAKRKAKEGVKKFADDLAANSPSAARERAASATMATDPSSSETKRSTVSDRGGAGAPADEGAPAGGEDEAAAAAAAAAASSSSAAAASSADCTAAAATTPKVSSDAGSSVNAVFTAMGLEEIAGEAEALISAALGETGAADGDDDAAEEVPGAAEEPERGETEASARGGTLHQRGSGGGGGDDGAGKSAGAKKDGAAAASKSAQQGRGGAGPDITVTADSICARLKSNVGLMRTEYKLSTSKLSFLKFVVERYFSDDPEVIFDDPAFAFACLALNVGTIHRDTWVELADSLPCIAHEALMPSVFDALTHGDSSMTWLTFSRFVRELRAAQHPVDESWEKAVRRGSIPADEPYVARFASVRNQTTRPAVAGTLFVSRGHLVHMSSVLSRVTVRVPLASISSWTVVPSGPLSHNREVCLEIDGGKRNVVLEFPYMTDIRTIGQEHRAEEFCLYLRELEATRKHGADLASRRAEAEGWCNFATQHLVAARAVTEAGGAPCRALFLSSNPDELDLGHIHKTFEKRHILSRGKRPVVFRSKRDSQTFRGVPFDLMLFAHHIDTLIDCIEPYNVAERFVIHVLHWRSVQLTGACFVACLAIGIFDLVRFLPSLVLVLLAALTAYLGTLTGIEGTVVIADEEKKSTGFFAGIRGTMDKAHAVHDGLQTTQNKLFKHNTRLLKLHSLFLRKKPEVSKLFMAALLAAAAVAAVVPSRWLWLAAVLYLFTWKFRSRDKNNLEKKFDGLYDSIPPVNPVNARPKKAAAAASSKKDD